MRRERPIIAGDERGSTHGGALRRLALVLAAAVVIASCGNASSDRSSASEDAPNGANDNRVSSPEPTVSEPLPVDESVAPSPEPTRTDDPDTAYGMPLLEETLEEGDAPDLGEGTEMYILVHAAEEGTPFVAQINGLDSLLFNARTPYYVDLDDVVVNEYGNVGSGSILIRNGHTEGAPIYVEYHSFSGESGTESCEGYDCDVQFGWSGYDIIHTTS